MLKLWLIGNRTLCRPIWSVIILVIKQIRLLRDFVNHSYDYRPNWTTQIPISPLSPVAFTYFPDKKYSQTPLFRTRLIWSPLYFEGGLNFLGFTLMVSVIYFQLFRTRLFRIPCYFELIVLSLHLKSTPLSRTCQQQSTYIRAQLETYCILFEFVLRN